MGWRDESIAVDDPLSDKAEKAVSWRDQSIPIDKPTLAAPRRAPAVPLAPASALGGEGGRLIGGRVPAPTGLTPSRQARTKDEWMWAAASHAARTGGTADDAWKNVTENGYVVGDLEDEDLKRMQSMFTLNRIMAAMRSEANDTLAAADALRAEADPEYWTKPASYEHPVNYRVTKAFLEIAKMSPKAADIAASILEGDDEADARRRAAEVASEAARRTVDQMLPKHEGVRSLALGIFQWEMDMASLGTRLFSEELSDRFQVAADLAEAAAPQARQQRWLRGAARSLPTTAIGVIIGGKPGLVVAIGGAGATEMNQADREARMAGLEGWERAGYVAAAGVVEMGTEALFYYTGFGGVEKLIGKGFMTTLRGRWTDVLKLVGIMLAEEIPQEILTEIGHNVRRVVWATDPDALSPERLGEIIVDTAVQTLLVTLAVSSPAAISNTIQTKRAVEQKQDMVRVAEEYEALVRPEAAPEVAPAEGKGPFQETTLEAFRQQIAPEDDLFSDRAVHEKGGRWAELVDRWSTIDAENELFIETPFLDMLGSDKVVALSDSARTIVDEELTAIFSAAFEEATGQKWHGEATVLTLPKDLSMPEPLWDLEGKQIPAFTKALVRGAKENGLEGFIKDFEDSLLRNARLFMGKPPLAPTAPVEAEATLKQKARAHIIAKEEAIPESAYRKLAVETTGKASMKDMTEPEAKAFIIALGKSDVNVLDKLTDREQQPLRAVSGESYGQVVEYANEFGEVPTESQARKDYLSNLLRVGREIGKRTAKLEGGQEPNALDHYSAARYAMLNFEARTGIPIHRTYTEMNHDGSEATALATDAFNAKLASIGKTMRGLALHKQNNEAITEYLYEEDQKTRDALFEALDEESQQLATAMAEFLADESARANREARWILWNAADQAIQPKIDALQEQIDAIEKKTTQTPKDKTRVTELKEDMGGLKSRLRQAVPKNAPKEALEEGRKAKAAGTLEEWIAGQTWGTRKNYFMSEGQRVDLTEDMERSVPEDIAAPKKKPGRAPKAPVEGVKGREGKADRLKGESVLGAVLRHYTMLRVFNATFDGTQKLWSSFAQGNPSARDITDMRNWVGSALGRPKASEPTAKVVRAFNRAFWRFHFLNPIKSAWFVMRQMGQNIAFGASQVGPLNLAAGMKNLLVNRAPGIMEAFRRVFPIRISQKRQIQHQFLLVEEGKAGEQFGNRVGILLDMVGVAAPLSDEANRVAAWFPLYQSGYDGATAYLKGERSFNSLSRGLRLGALPSPLQLEFHQLLTQGKRNQFAELYAETKVENIHFRYETALRSAAEQTLWGRLTLGLIAFPRGVYEILTRNGIRPFLSGIQDGNYNRAYQGLVTILSLMAGSWAAERLVKLITDKDAYDVWATILRYTPLAPGASKANELFEDVSSVLYRADRNDWTLEETADRLMAVAMNNLDMFLPFCDVYINYYEVQNDRYGVRVWTLVKSKLQGKSEYRTKKQFKFNKRDAVEKWQHMIFGGAEQPERK